MKRYRSVSVWKAYMKYKINFMILDNSDEVGAIPWADYLNK